MTLDEYQAAALSTAIYPTEHRIIYPALGLSGESGEVADKIKKVIRDHHAEFSEQQRRDIAIELGDVLWYCAAMARDLGFSLDEVAQMNVDKLKSRRQRGAIHGSGDNR
jgi:NTP pyrophosphatase (non-canonical NTP hydrolase)